MEWIEIDKEKLPGKTILAANFKPFTYGYSEKVIGYLYLNEQDIIVCQNEHEVLENCTHLIYIDSFDVKT